MCLSSPCIPTHSPDRDSIHMRILGIKERDAPIISGKETLPSLLSPNPRRPSTISHSRLSKPSTTLNEPQRNESVAPRFVRFDL